MKIYTIGATSLPVFYPEAAQGRTPMIVNKDTLITDQFVVDNFDMFDHHGKIYLFAKPEWWLRALGTHEIGIYYELKKGPECRFVCRFEMGGIPRLATRIYESLPLEVVASAGNDAPNWTPHRSKFPGTTGLPVRGWRPLHSGPTNIPVEPTPGDYSSH